MAGATTFKLLIVSPDKVVLETEAVKVTVPGFIQELAILPNHTPLYSELLKGTVRVETPDHSIKEVDIDGGIVRVRSNQVSIVLGFDAGFEQTQGKK